MADQCRREPWGQEKLDAVVAAEKDAGYQAAVWSPARFSNGSMMQATLNLGVTALGEDLHVRAEWKGVRHQQVMLAIPGTNHNIVRLCKTSCHDEPHWHYYERLPGIEEKQRDIPNLKGIGPGIDGLLDHFLAVQRVVNLIRSEQLFL